MQLLFCIGLGFTLFLLLAAAAAALLLQPSQGARRMLELVRSNRPDRRVVPRGEALREWLFAGVRRVRCRLGLAENPKLKRRLDDAGVRGRSAQEAFAAMRILLPLAALLTGAVLPGGRVGFMISLPPLAYLGPGLWLKLRTQRRREKIRRSIPDALDLLSICVEAGLGLDQAMLRIAAELSLSYPEIHEEFTQVNLAQRAGKARLDAWASLAERTRIEEFKGFTGMLMQSERFGTPIAKALQVFSDELRSQRRQHAEEAAAKTKIKIVFPLVFCIFPCVFIVLLAPALMSIGTGLASMSR